MSEEPLPVPVNDEEWHPALPEHLPRQTYVPCAVAGGLCLLFWGFITSPIIIGAGLGLMGLGIAGWIEELEIEGRASSRD